MKRTWLIGLSALSALAILDTLAWRIATAQLAAGADRWIADTRRQGWVVTERKRICDGWPFAARLAISGPEIAGGDALLPGGLRWSSQRLVLAISMFHPTRLALAAEGRQRLRLSGLPDLAFTGADLSASIKLWGAAPELANINALAVTGGIAGSSHPQDVQVESLRLRVTAVGDPKTSDPKIGDPKTGDPKTGDPKTGDAWPSATLEISAAGIGLPDIVQWPLGALVSELSLTLDLNSPAAGPAGITQQADPAGITQQADPAGITQQADPAGNTQQAGPAGPGDLESQARAWRDGGGRLDVHDIRLRWGPLRLGAAASLTLDKRLQPAGSGSADLAGSQATLAALSGAGVITPGLAATAGAMLAFMPRAPGDADAVRLPFQLRGNTVSVGQIPIFQVKDVRWK